MSADSDNDCEPDADAKFAMSRLQLSSHRVAWVHEEDRAREAVAIVREAAAWTLSRGIEVWRESELCDRHFVQAARTGQLVMGFTKGQPCATMLMQHADPIFWPEIPADTSFYLHKIARRPTAGNGWLGRLLKFAVNEARARRRGWLRLDTFHGSALQQLYEQHGFTALIEPPLLLEDRWMIRMARRL